MITEIGVENFKAFGKMQRMPLKPITLIYGPNSAGKSSLLQAFLLFKQTLEEGRNKRGALIPKGKLLDIGTYRDFINGNDEQKTFSISITMDLDGSFWHQVEDLFYDTWCPNQTITLNMSFALNEQRDIVLKAFDILDRVGGDAVTSYIPLLDVPEIKQAFAKWEDVSRVFEDVSRVFADEQIRNELERLKTAPLFFRTKMNLFHPCVKARWESLVEGARELQDEGESWSLNDDLSNEIRTLDALIASAREKTAKKSSWAEVEIKKYDQYASLAVVLNKFFANTQGEWSSLTSLIEGLVAEKLVAMENCFPQKLVTGSDYKRIPEVFLSGALSENINAHRYFLPIEAILLASQYFQQKLAGTSYIGPLRAMPERMYPYSGTAPVTVGIRGENAIDILIVHPDIVEEVNHWLRRMKVGHEITVRPVVRDYYEVVLINTDTKTESCLKDVGFGISQILPILVDAFTPHYSPEGERLIIPRFGERLQIIEQPEIHIHPRLQTELADFFIKNSKDTGTQYIIETHSEHLLLRLLRRIRETAEGELPPGQAPLRPEDVAVIYANPTDDGTELSELRISEDGDFLDRWPGGFFAERAEELF